MTDAGQLRLPVLLECPRCRVTGMFPDATSLAEYTRLLWEASTQIGDQELREGALSALGVAARQNTPERINSALLEKGYVEMFCRTCRADATEELFKRLNKDYVRKGNMFFAREFYRSHRHDCRLEARKDKQFVF